jgi:hypothetical protein
MPASLCAVTCQPPQFHNGTAQHSVPGVQDLSKTVHSTASLSKAAQSQYKLAGYLLRVWADLANRCSFVVVLQLLGCRGALAEREAGNIFATPARIHKIPNHAE